MGGKPRWQLMHANKEHGSQQHTLHCSKALEPSNLHVDLQHSPEFPNEQLHHKRHTLLHPPITSLYPRMYTFLLSTVSRTN